MAVLRNVRTLQGQLDPIKSLLAYIQDNYTLSTPAKDSIHFSITFDDFSKENQLIVEHMNKQASPEVIGKSRVNYTVNVRIQIYCNSSTAANDMFLIQEHLDDLINANPSAMQTDYGINEIHMTDFQPIYFRNEQQINNMEVNEQEEWLQRSWTAVTMKYTKYRV